MKKMETVSEKQFEAVFLLLERLDFAWQEMV